MNQTQVNMDGQPVPYKHLEQIDPIKHVILSLAIDQTSGTPKYRRLLDGDGDLCQKHWMPVGSPLIINVTGDTSAKTTISSTSYDAVQIISAYNGSGGGLNLFLSNGTGDIWSTASITTWTSLSNNLLLPKDPLAGTIQAYWSGAAASSLVVVQYWKRY